MEPVTIRTAIDIMRKACIDRMQYVTTIPENRHIVQLLDEIVLAQRTIASGVGEDNISMYAINDNDLVLICRPDRPIECNVDSL